MKSLSPMTLLLGSALFYAGMSSAPLTNIELIRNVQAEQPNYKPPTVGSPSRRVGGGTRSKGTPPMITLLAPESIGYTLQSQPTIYWAISSEEYPVDIQLGEANPESVDAMQPLLEKQVKVEKTGIQKLDLKSLNVSLKPGVEYELFISAVMNKENRGQDVISSAILKFVPEEAQINQCMQQAGSQIDYEQYTRCGVWYDAIADLSTKIDSAKDKTALKKVRQALMVQVQLPEVAAMDQ